MTAKVAHPWWAFSQSGAKIQMHCLGTHGTERDARAACPPGATLLRRDEIRDLAYGRFCHVDLNGPFRLRLAYECARIAGLQEQAKRWATTLAVFEGTTERTGRLDEPKHTDAKIEEAALKCFRAIAPSLVQALTPEQLEAMGQRFALANGFSTSEGNRVGELVRAMKGNGNDSALLRATGATGPGVATPR